MKAHSTFIVLVMMAALAAIGALVNWYLYFVEGSDVEIVQTDSLPVFMWLKIVGDVTLLAVAARFFFAKKNLYARAFWGILIVEATGGVAWEFFGTGLSSNIRQMIGGINSTCFLIVCLVLLAAQRSGRFTLFEDS